MSTTTGSLRRRTFFDYFPVPEFLLLSTSGISITDEDVKFIQLRGSIIGNELKLVHSGKLPLPEGTVDKGVVVDGSALKIAFNELGTRYGLQYVRATLPDEKAYLFTATIGRVPASQLENAVGFIIEENVPLSLSEAVFSYEVVDDRSPNEIKITVAAMPQKVASAYIDIFESAGITPISFELESQAIARAVIERGEPRTTLLINLEAKKTGFYVVEDEVVQFSTTVSQDLSAENIYNYHDLKLELKKVLAFWNARIDKHGRVGKKIERVIFCGNVVEHHAVVEALTAECPIEAELGDAWVNIDNYPKNMNQDFFKESLEYSAAIGVALPRRKTYV